MFAIGDEDGTLFGGVGGGCNAGGGQGAKYRLHLKIDEEEKNLVSRRTVVKGVLLYQTFEVVVTCLLLKATGNYNGNVTSPKPSLIVLAQQFVVGALFWDTWQYFGHRILHQNKFLYKHIHSQHHRVIVNYAFAAHYHHFLEGFILDTVGGILSVRLSGMSPRASIFFFSFAVIKIVDDHCGSWLPRGNVFHIFFRNNTAFHAVHHQLYGSKYNFSQIFFVHWDKILGTYMPYSLEERAGGGFEARSLEDSKDD
ncbi:Sphingoid base hydroxylase 2 [Morus notabilis]|uniref:Sphingoid base hydroxylase 2 n=1 Tax=Morus notabilis TaxID=981085 RepID=W9QIN3_9ROSA|nr:Sphingoid base hydroxylase 2 [Morus notabilis]